MGGDRPDHAGLLEVADPVQGRRWGQADRAGQIDVCNICIRLEQRQQMNVNFIKGNGHSTER